MKSNPVLPLGPGVPVEVQLLFDGKPLTDHRISFIPRGHELSAGFDADYERKTDAQGMAMFIPDHGNTYLIVAHHEDPDAGGDGYQSTKYAATIVVRVPAAGDCCQH